MATLKATKDCKEQERELDCSVLVPRRKIYNLLSQPICEEPWTDKNEDPDRYSRYNILGQRIATYPEDTKEHSVGGDCRVTGSYGILGQRLLSKPWQPREDEFEKKSYNLLGQAVKK